MGTQITGGVDTHLEVHVAAALDDRGGLLRTASFATTADGYRELVEWLSSFGDVALVGSKGPGATAPASLATSKLRGSLSSRSIDRTGNDDDEPASRTPTTQ